MGKVHGFKKSSQNKNKNQEFWKKFAILKNNHEFIKFHMFLEKIFHLKKFINFFKKISDLKKNHGLLKKISKNFAKNWKSSRILKSPEILEKVAKTENEFTNLKNFHDNLKKCTQLKKKITY